MVLGLTRPRTRPGGPVARSSDRPSYVDDPARRWHSERGEILFEATCDVFGGFPGYAACGGHLDGPRLRVTEYYLLIGDGEEHGFGLPIRDIEGVALVPLADGEESALRVFYQDGASPRLFTVRFHGNRLSLRSGPRAERAYLSLLRAGLDDRFAVSPPPDPEFIVSWEQTAEFEAENVLWTGQATVPRSIGAEGVPGNVWLTTRSLIWGCETVAGVHRIPLALITDVAAATVADRAGTPAVYVGLGDETTGHFDLAFLFDQQSTSDHNQRERGALLVGLRSRGVPVGSPTPPFQPWRHVAYPVVEEPESIGQAAPDEEELPLSPVVDELARRRAASRRRFGTFHPSAEGDPYPAWPEPPASFLNSPPAAEDSATVWDGDAYAAPSPRLLDVVLAEWSALPEDRGTRDDDVQLAAGWLSPLPVSTDEPASSESDEVAIEESPGDHVAQLETVAAAPPTELASESERTEMATWPRVAAYESATVGVLAEILAAIRDRATGRMTPLVAGLPSAADQTAALAELTALSESGAVTPDQLRGRSARILALGDACVRLRTLVELRDAGHVSDADLARRQQTITAQLAAVMEVG
jgi:hypothetical protein